MSELSIQWTNTFELRILKYSIKIIKNTTLQKLRAYMKPAIYHLKIGAGWLASQSQFCALKLTHADARLKTTTKTAESQNLYKDSTELWLWLAYGFM